MLALAVGAILPLAQLSEYATSGKYATSGNKFILPQDCSNIFYFAMGCSGL